MGKQAGMAAGAPSPAGPYAHYNIAGGMVYVSGQGPIDPQSGQPQLGSIEDETRLTLANLRTILDAAGSGIEHVVRCTVFLANLDDFQGMNSVYREVFGDHPPTRSTVGAKLLTGKVEIDCIAVAVSPPPSRGVEA